jgi:DNA polymerase-3 subunit beta
VVLGSGRVRGFDYEVDAEHLVPELAGMPDILVDYLALVNVLKGVKGAVSFAVAGDYLMVTTPTGVSPLNVLPVEDFPAPPLLDLGAGVSLPVSRFVPVLTAIGKDKTLPVLTAVSLQSLHGVIEIAATDRYRLGVVSAGDGEIPTVLIPGSFVKHMVKVHKGECVHIAPDKSGSMMEFRVGVARYMVRLLDGTFPKYESLIPTQFQWDISINRAAMISAVDSASAYCTRNTPVRLDLAGGELVVSVKNGDGVPPARWVVGQGVAPLGVEETHAFNPDYLLDCLRALDGVEVKWSMNMPTKPSVFTGDDTGVTLLVMPVRLSGI